MAEEEDEFEEIAANENDKTREYHDYFILFYFILFYSVTEWKWNISVAPVVAENDDIAEYEEIADATTENILTSPGYDGTTKYDTELDQVHLSNILYLSVVPIILLISGDNIRGRSWKTPLAAI